MHPLLEIFQKVGPVPFLLQKSSSHQHLAPEGCTLVIMWDGSTCAAATRPTTYKGNASFSHVPFLRATKSSLRRRAGWIGRIEEHGVGVHPVCFRVKIHLSLRRWSPTHWPRPGISGMLDQTRFDPGISITYLLRAYEEQSLQARILVCTVRSSVFHLILRTKDEVTYLSFLMAVHEGDSGSPMYVRTSTAVIPQEPKR